MKTLFLVFAFAMILVGTPFLASTQTVFERTYGGPFYDEGACVQTLADGYVIAGIISPYATLIERYYAIRTDLEGNVVWYRAWSGPYRAIGSAVVTTRDSGFVFAGSTWEFEYSDLYLRKTNRNGNTEWTTIVNAPATIEYGHSLVATMDNGFLIVGERHTNGHDVVLLAKFDSLGIFEWESTHGFNSRGLSVALTDDGGYIVAGTGTNSTFAHFARVDPQGNLVLVQTYSEGTYTSAHSIQQASPGRYIAAGSATQNGVRSVYLVMLNDSLEVLWSRLIGDSNFAYGKSVLVTPDGGFIVAGRKDDDAYLVRTDSSGQVLWENTFGGTEVDEGLSVGISGEGGYVLAGGTYSMGFGGSDVYLVKTVELPLAPNLRRPPDGSVLGSTSVNFSWDPSDGATSYHLILAKDPGFVDVVLEDSTLTHPLLEATGLEPEVDHFWKVSARNAGGASLWSATWSFSVDVTSVDPTNDPLLTFALRQNHPNPFNPTTTFEFSIPTSLFANLSVYNLLGEKIATVVNENLSAGTHRAKWDAVAQPSGVYFYRLRAGEFVETRKLVLLR